MLVDRVDLASIIGLVLLSERNSCRFCGSNGESVMSSKQDQCLSLVSSICQHKLDTRTELIAVLLGMCGTCTSEGVQLSKIVIVFFPTVLIFEVGGWMKRS